MARTDNLNADGLKDVLRRLGILERATPLNNASIGRNGLRVHSGGVITIENGGLKITGTAQVIGQLLGSGTITWTGPTNLNGTTTINGPTTIWGTTRVKGQFFVDGPVDINGLLDIYGDTAIAGTLAINGSVSTNSNLTINGNASINGATSLNDDLTVTGGGSIKVGSVSINPGAGGSGGMSSSGYIRMASQILWASQDVYAERDVTAVRNMVAFGAKTFQIPHPTREGYLLRHGATESPVSGVEYWGRGTIAADGTARVDLPDYFDALTKPDRYILVTGNGFAAGWSEIDGNHFDVTGPPDGHFTWLVKAERHGGEFETEAPGENPPPPTLT